MDGEIELREDDKLLAPRLRRPERLGDRLDFVGSGVRIRVRVSVWVRVRARVRVNVRLH